MSILRFKNADCKNCYKCLRECPVKAISMINNQAQIIDDLCILCGKCTNICPQNAKEVINTISNVKELLSSNKDVIASVAPSFIANFNVSNFEVLRAALIDLGFKDAFETAVGAKYVDGEYIRILNIEKYPNFITSCCPSVNYLIQKYYPKALKYLAPVDSPMVAHAKMIKKNHDCYVVFIGPCIAKKDEAHKNEAVDEALTFVELSEMFNEKNIDLKKYSEIKATDEYNSGRFYPVDRGIIKSIKTYDPNYEYVAVSGISECIDFLEHIDSVHGMFVEMNACPHSCVNGPAGINSGEGCIKSIERVRKYTKNTGVNPIDVSKYDIDASKEFKAYDIDYKIPTETEIRQILQTFGKYTKEDELNCGACGYQTCRDKAIAVYNNKAEKEMCLPFMKEQAVSLSNEVIKNSPNGIISLDENNIILDCNERAKVLLGIDQVVKKKNIGDVREMSDIALYLINKKAIDVNNAHISKTKRDVEVTSVYVKNAKINFAIIRDCTLEEEHKKKLKEYRENTINLTNSVIDKQMRTVQEIASLLGETTAETKLEIYKLRQILIDNEGK